MRRVYADSVVFAQDALEMCVRVCGTDNGASTARDYPHTIGDMAGCLARVDGLAGDVRDKVRVYARRIFGL